MSGRSHERAMCSAPSLTSGSATSHSICCEPTGSCSAKQDVGYDDPLYKTGILVPRKTLTQVQQLVGSKCSIQTEGDLLRAVGSRGEEPLDDLRKRPGQSGEPARDLGEAECGLLHRDLSMCRQASVRQVVSNLRSNYYCGA